MKATPAELLPDFDAVSAALAYDPETGFLTWRKRRTKFSFQRAGQVFRDGYRRVHFAGYRIMEHRLAWLLMTGEWPSDEIDHANLVRDDNRWVNLRPATRCQNQGNLRGLRRRKAENADLPKGVIVILGRYRATFRRKCLGHFDTAEQAHAVYRTAASKHFGEFARFE